MQILFTFCVGIGLSAACGFRVFVPMFVMSLGAKAGYLDLSCGFQWIGSWPALVAFGTATTLEIGGYYVPWLDNLLDTIATPAAAVAGSIATTSMVGDLHPMLQWSVGIIAGGGTATAVQALTVGMRAASAVTTGGLGNPAVATAEAGASVGLSVVAIVVVGTAAALVLGGSVLGLLFWLVRRFLRRRSDRAAAGAEPPEAG